MTTRIVTATVILAVLTASLRSSEKVSEAEQDADEAAKRQVYAGISAEDEVGYERLDAPKPGEWLASFHEIPQTMERYRNAASIRPTDKRKVIVLQPLGKFSDEQTKVLEALCEYTQVFFQMPARLEKPLELTADKPEVKLSRNIPLGHRRGTYDTQYNANAILEHVLLPHLPDDAVVCLGITMEDLWADDLNYVFGLGSMNQRVGVYSLCRYFPEFWGNKRAAGDDVKALLRSCKVLNHETGHMFGLSHCVFYHCSMNGSNSLAETDVEPVHFCPLCDRKLAWNIGFGPLKRYEALKDFYAKNGLTDESDWTARRIKQWQIITAKQKSPRDE
jgi:archaemetzincin